MQSPLIQCFGIPHAKQIDSQSEISFQGCWRKHSMFDSVKWKVSCDYDRLKLTLTEGSSNTTYSFINAEKEWSSGSIFAWKSANNSIKVQPFEC